MAEEIFQRPLLSFDMQGQSIKEVLLKSVKIEEIEALPEASENYNRVLFNKGELKYSNGEKWIGQAEMVGLGLVVKTNFNDSNIPKGQIDINGHRATLFNKIDNSDLSLMPTKTIKGNRTDSDASPTDITYDNFARDMRDSTLLGITLTTKGGVYILKQGDVEVGRFSTSSFVDTIELVQGYWSEDKMTFTEDKEGTDLAMKLTIKKELDNPSIIYLDVSKLIDVYNGGTTDTINVKIEQTDEGYNVLAEIKEYSIKKEHLSKELNTEIEEAISSAQIQADWNQTDATQKDFIKNKPTHLPSPTDSITTEQLQAGVVTNAKLANKTINFNGQTFELGAVNQNLAPLKNTGFEVVTALPTTNLFAGRKVIMNGIEYTYNGNLWTSQLDPLQKYYNNTDGIKTPLTTLNARSYELQLENNEISQISQLLANNSISLTDHVLQSSEYMYERMDNGTTNWVETTNKNLYLGDKLRFTAWKDWETDVRGLSSKRPGSVNYIQLSINARSYKMKVTIEYLTYTNTLGNADVDDIANYTWWKVYEKEFPEQKTTWIFPLQRLFNPNSISGNIKGHWYIHNVRITIESITAGTTESSNFVPNVSIYTSNQINPTTAPININYNAKIKPTQDTTTYKTNNWVLQYLTQGVNWLRDNKVETNSDATLRTLTIKGDGNKKAILAPANNSLNGCCIQLDGKTPFTLFPTVIRPSLASSNTVELGNTDSYWKSVRAGKYIVHGGTSSQFLKADGSLDSNSYATLDSTGKVEKSILADDLGGREETREEQFTYQATAGDESVKDGLAVVKSIKGNTVVANQLVKNGDFSNGTVDWELRNITIQDNNDYLTLGITITDITSILSQPITVIQNHIYLLTFTFRGKLSVYFAKLLENNYKADDFTKVSIKVTATDYNYLRFYPKDLCDLKKDVRVFDLTQLFGAGNEPATVEEFERLYPNLPTEYNEGSLLNLNADSIKSVGFNAFNGEYAKVLGGMQYYFNGNITSLTFKENLEDEGEVIEIPSDNLYTPTTNGYLFASGSDICINLSHSGYRNGEYEPYKESIANLPIKKYFPDGMKSAGGVRDEIVWDESIGKYKAIQRIDTRAYQTGDEDLENVRTDKTNTYYELETPIETIIDDYDLIDYEVSDFGTEEIIADETTTPIIADIQYGFNAVDEIRNHRFEIKDLKKKSNQHRQMLDTLKGNVTNVDDKVIEIDTKLEDLDTIRTNASNGNTAYGWGNHANAGYVTRNELMHQYVTPNLSGMNGMIGLDEHKCGVSPIVQAYFNGTQVLCEISNDGSGNISWASNIYLTEDSNFKLVIIGNPNESTKLI